VNLIGASVALPVAPTGAVDQTEAVRKCLPPLVVAVTLFCWVSASVSAAPTATKTDKTWAQAANRICLTYARRLSALGTPPVNDRDGLARWLQKTLPLLHAEIADLARLHRPPLLAPRITRWIAVLTESEQVTRKIIVASNAEDISRLATLGQRSVVLYTTFERMARSLGATACASSTHP
jgi:hypothetical protein